jgi:hypothetical protein
LLDETIIYPPGVFVKCLERRVLLWVPLFLLLLHSLWRWAPYTQVSLAEKFTVSGEESRMNYGFLIPKGDPPIVAELAHEA